MPAEVEFFDAEDLRDVLRDLISRYKTRFGHLQTSFFCLRRRKSETPARWIAKISLVPKRFKDKFDGAIYILEVDASSFDSLDEEQKRAVLFHELCHTWLTEKGTHKLVQHDIQEFLAVIQEFGGYLPDTIRLMNIVKNRLHNSKTIEGVAVPTMLSVPSHFNP